MAIETPTLIGNSIGGAAAILFATRRPVRALVLCDSGGLVEVNATVKQFCGLFEAFFSAGERSAFWFPVAFDLYYRLVLPASAASTRRAQIVRGAKSIAQLLRQAWASFGQPEADLRAAAAAIEAPVWIAWARHDRVIPLSRARSAIARMKDGSLSVFEGGHTPFLEQPDAFAAAFRKFATPIFESVPVC